MKKTIQLLVLFMAIGFNSFAQTVDLQKGLVAYYPFNGNANDESGNGNHGTIYGASSATDKNGKLNSAYSFDGKNDYIKLSDRAIITTSNNSSICFWTRMNGEGGGIHNANIIFQQRDDDYTSMIVINLETDNEIRFSVRGGSSSNLTKAITKSKSFYQWYHYAFIIDNDKVKIYINGKLEYSSNNIAQGSANKSIDYVDIGRHRYKGKQSAFYNGEVDEFRIYNRALNEAEIQALYNYQETVNEKPVITFKNPNSTYSTVNQSSFKLNACIKSSEPLKSYAVYVNGTSNRGFNVVPSSECVFKIDKTINLHEGNNTIKIVAENSGGTTTSNTYTLNYVRQVTDNSPPQITITNPNVSRGFKVVKEENKVTITGKATDASGIFEVLINGEPASVDALGNFSKTVLLAFGDNSFTVKATDIKQNTATETFKIERKSNNEDVVIVNNQTNNSDNLQSGKYYALIIGNNTYQDPAITSLDEPINDATKLYNVLTTKYTFEPQNVTFLKNATYVQMIEAFDNMSNKITENDNLIVFYADHGWWDDSKELGYWLPSNAKKSSTAFWIRNSTISDYMSSIKTKHTLLVADACFSGSIFKTRAAFSDAGQAINSLYELPSRTAMTSGNLKEVPDKSVFLEYLVKRLENNNEKYLPADQLFVSFRIAVMNNSQTEPQFGTIQNAGDEGGEFIFIRK